MRRVMILLVVVGVCGVVGAVGFASARSSVAWVVVLGSSDGVAYPDVVADGALGFDAVWTDADQRIVTAHRSAVTGRWTRPVVLSGDVAQAGAQVAGSGSGAAAAIWYVGAETRSQGAVRASYRPSVSGAWERTVTLAQYGAWDSLQVAIDAHGDAFAAWVDGRGVVMSEHRAGASAWSPAMTVEAAGHAASSLGDLALAVSPAGTIALAWERYLSGSTLCCASKGTRNRFSMAIRPSGRRVWLSPVSLGLDGTPVAQDDTNPYWYTPQITINAHGTVFVASQSPHADEYGPRVAVISPADQWRKPRFAALPASSDGAEPAIAARADGDSTVVWISGALGGLSAADLSPTAHILNVRHLPRFSGPPRLAEDGSGDLAGAWYEAAYRPAGHEWCPGVAVDEGNSVAIAPDGVAEVVWDGPHGVEARTLTSCRR